MGAGWKCRSDDNAADHRFSRQVRISLCLHASHDILTFDHTRIREELRLRFAQLANGFGQKLDRLSIDLAYHEGALEVRLLLPLL